GVHRVRHARTAPARRRSDGRRDGARAVPEGSSRVQGDRREGRRALPVSQTLNVHVRVTEAATGRPTPVRIRIGGADGTYYPPLGRPPDFPIGRNEDVGGHVYLNGKRYAYIDGGAE